MFHKTSTLSIFALLLAVASCRPQGDLFDCSGKVDGPHADPLDNNAFYVCFGGELTVHSKCDAEEYFDGKLKTCTGGSENEDLTVYTGEGEYDDSVDHLKSTVSEVLNEAIENMRYTGRPPNRPSPPQNPNPPQEPSQSPYQNKIINVQLTKNIFPKSVLIVGRANREQKNK